MEIKWLRVALENLNSEAEYLAEEDSELALKFVNQVVDAISRLRENPAIGRPGRIHGTRELVIQKSRYIVPYRVRPKLQQIEILRIFHTSRLPPKRW